jgi:hypothetical protein
MALVESLLDGEIAAGIVGDKLPDPKLKHLIPDAEGAGYIGSDGRRRAILAFGRVPQLAFDRVPQPEPKTGELNHARGPKGEKRSAGRIARSHWGRSGPGCSASSWRPPTEAAKR